jgi:hypothetical protein
MSFVDLKDVPYIKHLPKDGRDVLLSAYYDHAEKRWTMYSPFEGKILALNPSDLVDGIYVSTAPVDAESDIRIEFTEFVFQHYSIKSLADINDRIEQDLLNELASIHKYFVILHHLNTHDDRAAVALMTSEIEYALTNHRSFYDLLNRAVIEILRYVTPPVQELPDSFRRVAQKPAEDLVKKFRLPGPLVDFYKAKEGLFMILRRLRDGIVHEGKTPDLVFHFPDGFGVSLDRHIFSPLVPLGLWKEGLLKPNRIGSLLVVFNFLVRDMFDTMNVLAQQLKICFDKLPPPVAEGYSTYLRSGFTPHLAKSDFYFAKQWVRPDEVLTLNPKPA